MSRNPRHKFTATPSKTPSKRISRTIKIDNSSDDDYAGVDDIPDTEEDEPDVEGVEEQHIIESEEEDADELQVTPRPSQDEEVASWQGFSEDEYLGQNTRFFDEEIVRMNPPNHDTRPSVGQSGEEASLPRRVRFEVDSDSPSEYDSDEYAKMFPDIFMPQDNLDSGFRREIESNENNDDGNSSGNDSYWDFDNSEENSPFKAALEQDSGSESVSSTGSSGYDSEDDGETTEEDEDLPPQAKHITPGQSVLRAGSDASESEEEITVTRRAPLQSTPRLGRWIRDPTKPFAIITGDKRQRLLLFKAITSRFSLDGLESRPPLEIVQDPESPQTILDQDMSPMISNSANLMMSAMHTPFDNLFNGQGIGPPEAFYPWTNVTADGTITQDSPSSFEDEDFEHDSQDWQLEDLFNFGEDDAADDADSEEENPSSDSLATAREPTSTPARPTTTTSEDQVHPLLNHFNSGVVGAFRKNQTRHQLLSRNTESHASLQFQGPHRSGTIRGIKGGRLQAANTPITPLRKQKVNRNIGPVDSSPLSYLTGGAMEDKKRKFDMEDAVRGHKRSKSLY